MSLAGTGKRLAAARAKSDYVVTVRADETFAIR